MNAPFILESQDVDNVHVQSDDQTSRPLEPQQPGDAERPGRRDHEELAKTEERGRDDSVQRLWE